MHYTTTYLVQAGTRKEAESIAEDFLTSECDRSNDWFKIQSVMSLVGETLDEIRKVDEATRMEIDDKEKSIGTTGAGIQEYCLMSDVADYRRGIMFPCLPLYNITEYTCTLPDNTSEYWAVTVDQHF